MAVLPATAAVRIRSRNPYASLLPRFCYAYGRLLNFQGIRSEDRSFAEGFAPIAEIFYSNRVKVQVPLVVVSASSIINERLFFRHSILIDAYTTANKHKNEQRRCQRPTSLENGTWSRFLWWLVVNTRTFRFARIVFETSRVNTCVASGFAGGSASLSCLPSMAPPLRKPLRLWI